MAAGREPGNAFTCNARLCHNECIILEGIKIVQATVRPGVSESKNRGGLSLPTRIMLYVLAGAFIFSLGVNVGKGNLAFASTKKVASGVPDNLNYTSVEAVYDKIRMDFDGDLDNEKLMDGLKAGLAQATGDPYTEYFNAKAAKDFNDQLGGTFSGIGAELGKDANGSIIVISPLAGYPAEKAGVRAKDIIIEINGESTAGVGVEQAVTKIRGEAGTSVKLKVLRSGAEEAVMEITRQQIKLPSVKYEITDGVGILTISRFGDDTTKLSREAADEFRKQNVKAVLVDLRGDPGGLLDASVAVSGLWVDKSQTVVQEKRGGKVAQTLRGSNSTPLKGIKTVVLINEGSASASEIMAGALRDNNLATLMGTKSFGKGSVQQIEDLGNGSMVKVTIAHWFTPNGTGIDKTGLEPDIKVERTEDDFKNNRDPQKDAALAELKK